MSNNDDREQAGGPSVDGSRDPDLGHLPTPVVLTRRQRQIATLIARGFSNEDIANALVLTSGTVANHVAAMLGRLGLNSRGQIAAWATANGLNGTQDRLLGTLERLLEVQPTDLRTAMNQVSTLIAEVLGTDKVDAFLHDSETDTMVAVGASHTPMGRQQHAVGLDRQPVANGGRAVEIFQTGESHADGHVDQDPDELIGIKRTLGVRSQIGVPLEVAGDRRGALVAQSSQADFFAQRDLLFLQAVSRWVGNVVHRVELVERTTAAAREQGRRLAAEELVTVLAHDLRNYITPLRARLEMLARRASREQHATNLSDAQNLLLGVDRLRRLISDLLDVARVDQGLFTISPQPVDVATLARELADDLDTPTVQIRVQAPPELSAVADIARLRQALANLLANATQHSPDGGTVSLDVSVEQRDGGTWAVFTVSDNGSGIPPDVQRRLFERFVKTSDSQGLGIGLYLARQIAAAHGGVLEVTSNLGQGTTFRLSMPTESPSRSR